MKYEEHALLFDCVGDTSVSIVSLPLPDALPPGTTPSDTGLLIVVGGPQYRVGSHRLFVKLARHAASEGLPTMRFDYRGMGDSFATLRTFESVDDDLRAAMDAFFQKVPTLKHVVLWGLCDGASAACIYAPRDARVRGLILVNPWVHTPEGFADTRLKHYYLQRVLDPSFWRKLLGGKVGLRSLLVLLNTVRQSAAARVMRLFKPPAAAHPDDANSDQLPLPSRMGRQVCRSGIGVAVALSDDDAVAREFEDQAMPTAEWRQALAGQMVELARLPGADHTVTSPDACERLCALSAGWVRALSSGQRDGPNAIKPR